MKKITLALAAFALAGSLAAQENRFSLGVELAVPVGDLGKGYSFGIGGTAGLELPFGDHIGVLVQAGYISFIGKDITAFGVTVKNDAQGMIPIQAGLKYYFTDNQEGFYAGVLTGVHMTTMKVTDYDAFGTPSGTKTKTNTNFSLAPLVGFMIGENIDIALRYQMVFYKGSEYDPSTMTLKDKTVNNSYLGLRFAYMFGGR